MNRPALAIIALMWVSPAGGVAADSVGQTQANQAMTALQNADYGNAIAGFTQALASRQLTRDEVQIARAARGYALLQTHDYWSAIEDLDIACRDNPQDADSQSRLRTAIAAVQPAGMIRGLSAKRIWSGVGTTLLKGAAAGIVQGLSQPQ